MPAGPEALVLTLDILRGGMVPALIDGTKNILSIIEETAVREDFSYYNNSSALVGGI